MVEDGPKATETDANVDEKDAEPRMPRSIRFSDSEWATVEQAARERGITSAVLVRHAAMTLATGRNGADPAVLMPGHVALIERTFRSVYILSTLKRDEMVREGRGNEMDTLVKAARESQTSLLSSASE